jgi:hypothetical protein
MLFIHLLDTHRSFSTSRTLKVNDINNLEEDNNENNVNSPTNSNEADVSNPNSPNYNGDDESGYNTDSNHSYYEEGTHAMVEGPVREIPEDYLRQYIAETKEIVKDPILAGVEGDDSEGESMRNEYLRRHLELRSELRRRKDEGTAPDSSSESDFEVGGANNEYDNIDSPSNYAATTSDNNVAIASDNNIATTSDNNVGSSSTNKRKFEADEVSATQPPRGEFQDSSGIMPDTEPVSYGWDSED